MEVLIAARVAPVSVRRASASPPAKRSDDRRLLPLNLPKLPTSCAGESGARRSLALISSVLGWGGLARALTYEEALQQSVGSFSSFGGSSDVDVAKVLNLVTGFVAENPLVIGVGAAVLSISLVLSLVLKKPKSYGIESAKGAYAKLAEDGDAQLLDIREGKDFKEVGRPDLRSLKKKAVSITYEGDDKPGFLKKLALRFKDPENTTLFILDKFGGNSELVAELVTANGFKAAFAIKNGAEGARGWMNSGLPWSAPKKTVDFADLRDAITGNFGEGTDGLPVTLGLAAATGLGLLAFSEIETVLQLLGSAALIQFFTKKFLFAEDRKVTLQQLDEFLNTKVAPKEIVGEIKMIGKALLPSSNNVMASLPAPSGSGSSTTPITPDGKIDVVPAAEPPEEVYSATKAEVKSESISGVTRALSPYPYYPDFKPPSSPSPSPP